jgi:hypothetical protein
MKSRQTAQRRKKKQSISGQQQQREKGAVGAEMGAGKSNIPPSQISHKKAAISRADWLEDEGDFRNIDSSEVEACYYYEFFRESAVMRGSIEDGHWSGGVLPVCEDLNARSPLMLALNKAGWAEAKKKNQAPPPWNSLNAETKTEISRCAKRCLQDRSDYPKWRPRLLVQEFLPGHDPVELKLQLEKWREKSCDLALVDRTYFFGLFRLDETCNEEEAVIAFRAFFRKRYGETKGSKSGRDKRWRERLNQLAVMRIWKRFPKAKHLRQRMGEVAKLTDYKGCNDYVVAHRKAFRAGQDEPTTRNAKVEMSKARAHALSLFQSLFPGEKPLNY